jgi:hypothetical protein
MMAGLPFVSSHSDMGVRSNKFFSFLQISSAGNQFVFQLKIVCAVECSANHANFGRSIKTEISGNKAANDKVNLCKLVAIGKIRKKFVCTSRKI